MKSLSEVDINLDHVKRDLRLSIVARQPHSLFDAEENATENNEARYQLLEGCFYDYQLSDPRFCLEDIGENIILKHKLNSSLGTIAPNIFVGTLSVPILINETSDECGRIDLEVQSVKSGYRDDYRDMLEFITEKCTDLLLQVNSPVSQHFETDYTKDGQSLYQKFTFIRSIIATDEFVESVHRIVTEPVTKWAETFEEKDINDLKFLYD